MVRVPRCSREARPCYSVAAGQVIPGPLRVSRPSVVALSCRRAAAAARAPAACAAASSARSPSTARDGALACPRPGRRTGRPRRRCAAPATPTPTSARRRPRAPPTTAVRGPSAMLRNRMPSASASTRDRPSASSPAPSTSPSPTIATWSTVPKRTTPVDDDLSVSADDGTSPRRRRRRRPRRAAACAGARPRPARRGREDRSRAHGPSSPPAGGWQSAGTWRSPAPPSTRPGRRRPLPPVEQLRPDLWSLPVPMGGPLRYVSVYAFALDGGGLGLIDTGWGSDESWTALTAGLASIGGDVADVRGVLVTHLHYDHLGLAERVRQASGAWVAMHPADAAIVGSPLSATPPRSSPPRWTSSCRLGADRDEAAADVGPADEPGPLHPHGRPGPAARGRRARRLPGLAAARRPHPRAHPGPPVLRRGAHRAVLLRRPRAAADQPEHLHARTRHRRPAARLPRLAGHGRRRGAGRGAAGPRVALPRAGLAHRRAHRPPRAPARRAARRHPRRTPAARRGSWPPT